MISQILLLVFMANFANSHNRTFTNPILNSFSSSPCILKWGDQYYLTIQEPDELELAIYKSPIITNFRGVERNVIFRAQEGFYWIAPNKMVEIDGEVYIYFHMASHFGLRLYVIKASNPSNLMDTWSDPIRLLNDWEYEVNDGSVMKHNNQLYFVWTNISTSRSLFIAPMTSPTWVGSPKVLLREPREEWECNGRCVIDGVSFLYNGTVTYLIFSASSWATPDQCLGQMSIREGVDPLVVGNWHFVNEPVFWRNDEEDVYTIGKSDFTVSPDGTETWMVYHATFSPVHIDRRWTARLEKIEWNDDGSPRFPRPLGTHQLKQLPSGQVSTCACS